MLLTLLEVLGLALVVAGVATASVSAGLVVAGAALLWIVRKQA